MDRTNSVKNKVNNSVNSNILSTKLARQTRRTAALLCVALAGLGLAHGAAAQVPQANSPAVPTPYQSPLFHSGGSNPNLGLTPPFLNPLYGQLQGTPTETVGGSATTAGFPVQIPSFDLGAYNPLLAPGESGPTAYYPDHLADGGVYSWQAPFNYIPLSVGTVTVDDSAPASVPAAGATPQTSGFTLTGGWVLEPPAGGTSPAAGTATGGEYQRLPGGTVTNPVNGTATWTLVATTAGSYSVYYHIPDNIEDSTGVAEARSTQVTYQIATSGANAQTGTATVSQTEANSSQFLAGPFVLAVGDTVTVTLQRDATHNTNTNVPVSPATTGAYLIADSMTLQTAIGDVRSAPTAINATAFPADFANPNLKYWGIYVPAGTTNPVPATTTAGANNAPPDTSDGTTTGTPIYRYGDSTKSDPIHLIRQLVYFGRQDPAFSTGNTVDDSNTSSFSANGFNQVSDPTSTATGIGYRTANPVTASTNPATAIWSLVAPNGGDYYVTVHLPQTPTVIAPAAAQKRILDAKYIIRVNGVLRTTQPAAISQAQTGDVTLATGALRLNQGDLVTVSLAAVTSATNAPSYTVVADSVRIATGGTGAIYCVDGFTGGIVWRFQTPGGLNGPGAPVFSSPVVTHINVLVTPPTATAPAVYQNKLVVIVGDDNGMVYCLDAIGNGDGTSNSNAIDPTTGLPIYIPQPAYGATPPTQVDQTGYLNATTGLGHVGTTGAYWIYRPDPNRPKVVTGAGIGTVHRDSRNNAVLDPNSDLPVPAAFGTASPNVFVDPNVSTTADATTGSIPLVGGKAPSNAKVYLGNSNGVLYALDAVGVPIDGTSTTTYEASGDRFNASYDLRVDPSVFPAVPATDGVVPTPQPLWWFTLRGADANSTDNTSSADIESAPAIYTKVTTTSVTNTNGTITTTNVYAPTVYIGSAHEVEATSNVGRLYALNGTVGPSGNNGLTDPSAQPDPTAANYTGPGSVNYNIAQRPQINNADAADWSFPDAYDRTTNNATKNNQGQSSSKLPRPALGNITGSPVVFTNPAETDATRRTHIFFAANVGVEIATGSTAGTAASARPDETETGRVWAVSLDGSIGRTTNSTGTANSTVWAYPLANDPNNAALDTTAEPSAPLGSFLRATPAIGFVQFPANITNGDPTSNYAHVDAVRGDVKSQSVPMLYVATRGANDTALYAVDIDGGSDEQRLIYRQISPDGSIFQSSPVLITNTSVAPDGSNSGGNGGAVYAVAANTLYDFSATPISNPGLTDIITGALQNFPLIRTNKAYTGFGAISSPAVAAANTYDLLSLTPPTNYPYTANTVDWIYVGDSSTGFCRGITPYDTTDTGIPTGLGGIVPPTADSPGAVDLTASIQTYLVDAGHANSTQADIPPYGGDALKIGDALPVYDWGQNVYIRFANVVPPGTDPANYVSSKTIPSQDATTGAPTFYGNGGPIEFDISDSTDGTPPDHGTVPAVLPTKPALATQPLPNGFFVRSDNATSSPTKPDYMDTNLVTSTGARFIGAYTYAISDGTARRNTPGSTRRILNAKQVVHSYVSDGTGFRDTGTVTLVASVSNGNEVSVLDPVTKQYKPTLTPVPPVDQPTFGILNPLAVRAGGIPLQLDPGNTPPNAVQIGDNLGPFRGITSPIPNTATDLEALANGNAILLTAPTSTAGGGGGPTSSPVARPLSSTNPVTTPHLVVTSTGLIQHNSSGDNSDAPGTGATLPIGSGTTGEGLSSTNFGTQGAPFAMDVADRSALGLRANRLRVKTGTVSGGGSGLYWNDNSANVSGHDSVVNFLPWEASPLGYKTGANPSADYPDISASNISATLYRNNGITGIGAGVAGSADLTLGNTVLQPVSLAPTAPDPIAGRQVFTNPVQFHISIPHFQPANQQIYRQNVTTTGPAYNADQFHETTPSVITGPADIVFPMGYVTTRRLYVPDQNGLYRPGAAYRDVRVYTGVPPDYSTHMDTATVSVGQVPSGFGIQTNRFAPLTNSNPSTSPLATFNGYNPVFQEQFQRLTINNTGNVNLLNVHLDQKQKINTDPPYALPLLADAVDSASFIPGYDFPSAAGVGAVTGPRTGVFGNVPEDLFLVRSSLDSDLTNAYGRNPYIINGTNASSVPLVSIYPGATFHKAQVGSGQPSTLYVPDAPEGFTQGATLDVSPTGLPVVPNYATGPVYKALPYVSSAIPFGTPVGSYHGMVQVFEGMDPLGYSDAAKATDPPSVKQGPFQDRGPFAGLTAQIFPPLYGGAVGGIGTPGTLLDTFQIAQVGTDKTSLMRPSSDATKLNVTVVEDRMTDGATFGAVPMVDIQGAGKPGAGNSVVSTPDFAPAAFRDPASGNLSMYWTSGRALATQTSPYNVFAANVPFTLNTGGITNPPGYFLPSDPTQYWWRPFAPIATGNGTNSGLTIAQDPQKPATIYAFAVNVQTPSAAVPYQNTLLAYTVNPATGALGTTSQRVTDDPTQVKYGVKGLSCQSVGFTRSLWAFWTATTRGRTAIYYNSADPANNTNPWIPATGPATTTLLPIPAGLTAVADAAPLLINGNVLLPNGTPQNQPTIEVTYSGTAPDGNVDLYVSRYQPANYQSGSTTAADAAKLTLLPFPAVTEILKATGQPGGWYQARDVAWSRTSQLNLLVNGTPILYDTNNSNKPLFSRAVFDKASGLLVITGIQNPTLSTTSTVYKFGTTGAPVTAYIDLATGRVRFSAVPNAQVTAFFSPLARRMTDDSRANTGPSTFLDGAFKSNDAGADPSFVAAVAALRADRRWYVWHKSGVGGASPSATVYYKTQRLTAYLPRAVNVTKAITISLNGITYSGPVDVHNIPAVLDTNGTIKYPSSARLYFPISSGAEGEVITGSYTATDGTTTSIGAAIPETVQWQDELRSNDVATPTVATPTTGTPTLAASTLGLANVNPGYTVPLATTINENNITAFLDPYANLNTEHKVWLFWNSTRNGTADLYYETINPLFAAQ